MKTLLSMGVAVAAVVVLGGLMGLLFGLFEDKIEPGRIASSPIPVVGPRSEVRLHRVPQVEYAVGTVQPIEQTEVASRILADVVAVNVKEGDMVALGDVLVELDQREMVARVEQARQQVSAAQATFEEVQSRYARIKKLADGGVATAAELDRAHAELEAARASLSRAKEGLEEALAAHSYALLKAPIKGRVIHRRVNPGDTATPGSPLLHLYDPDRLRLEAHVRESLAAGLSSGDPLQVEIDALGLKVAATVEEVVPSADPGSRSFVVKAVVPSSNHLYPGMYGRLLIRTGVEEHISVPANAIRRVGQLEYVLLADGESAVRRYVRTGETSHDGRVEVLSGLVVGEQVVLPEDTEVGGEG